MKILLDKILYNDQHYNELENAQGKHQIEDVARKLMQLEQEIADSEAGVINITSNGMVLAANFNADLSNRINKAIAL